jgi:hypothetical protein
MTQLQWARQYSKKFNKFNEDVILGIREQDKMITYLDETWKEVQRHIPQNLKYLGYRFDDSGNRFRELNVGKEKKKVVKSDIIKTMSINDTYARLAIFQFEISVEDQQTNEMKTVYVESQIYIPLYVDKYHFYIRGNKYSTPFQITDAITYTNRANMVVLKTMTRAIKMAKEKRPTPIQDIFGNKYIVQIFYIYMSSKKVPFVLYYFAYFGFNTTFEYFGADKFCKFHSTAPLEDEDERIYFKFGMIYISVDRNAFNNNPLLRQFIASVLEVQKKHMGIEEIESTTRWKFILGSTISENNALSKGEGLLRTFIVSLDHRTIINIKKLIGGGPKESTFAVVRYIFLNFGTLSARTNSLANKRIRLSEYLINPVIQSIYRKLYRFLSTTKKNQDIDRCLDIIKIPSGLIIGAVSGKNKGELALDIAKYSSSCNDNTLLNVGLSYTTSGPGSASSKSGSMVSSVQRALDTSYLGRLCISTSTNSSPGLSGTLSPMTDINMETLTFIPIEEMVKLK